MNIYGIYNKLSDFLEEGQQIAPSQNRITQQIEQTADDVGRKMKEYKEKIFHSEMQHHENRHGRQLTQSQQQQQQQQNRSTSFLGKLEQQWDKFKNSSKSPMPVSRSNHSQQVISEGPERRRIFEVAPQVQQIQRSRPKIFLKDWKDNTTSQIQRLPSVILNHTKSDINLSLSALDDSIIINKTINNLMNEDTKIEEMYYQQDNEVEILGVLIKKLGSSPNTEKLALLLENLTKKNSQIKKELQKQAQLNQGKFEEASIKQDSLTFQVNQCCSRIARSRMVLSLLKDVHSQLGLRVQRKLQNKAEIEQQIVNLKNFKVKHQQIFDLISELRNEKQVLQDGWTLQKVIQVKDIVWNQTRDAKFNLTQYQCFNDIRGYIDGLFQAQLESSFKFFTENILSRYLEFDGEKQKLVKITENMCDYLMHYELVNKSKELSKQLKQSLPAQFRSLQRTALQENLHINRTLLKKNIKYESLTQLNIYLNSFLIAFYQSAYALKQIDYVFSQLIVNVKASQNKQQLIKKVGFQFNYEKNHFWEYIQDKFVKSLKRTKLDNPIVYKDWAVFEQLTYKIIQIGEESSNLKSEVILKNLLNILRLLAQGIQSSIIQCFSVQKGIGTNIKPIQIQNFQYLFPNLPKFLKQKRMDSRSQYLINLIDPYTLLPQLKQELPIISSNDQIYSKKEEYYFIISQMQELLFFAQEAPQYQIDCFLHTIHCFEFYCFLLIRNDLSDTLQEFLEEINHQSSDFNQIIRSHDWICKYNKYQSLISIIVKQMDSLRSMGIKVEVLYTSSSLREIIENISLLLEVFEFISTSYQNITIKEDKEIITIYLNRTLTWLSQLKDLWLYNQGLKDSMKYLDKITIQSYQLFYNFNELIHFIQKANQVMNSKIKPEYIVQIYFKSFVHQIIQITNQTASKQNKLQLQAELQKFQKSINFAYDDQLLREYILLLDIKSQAKCSEQLKQILSIPISIQIELITKEYNLDSQIKKTIVDIYNEKIAILI